MFHQKSKIYDLRSKISLLRSRIYDQGSFTLLELLIVISLIALLAVAGFFLLNPKRQIEKSWDTRRKNDLSQLQKVFEDFYNDKQCYPKPVEICYNSTAGSVTCNICGNESTSPQFPYLSRLPCDPQPSTNPFFYQVDNDSCPRWYRVYNKLSNASDLVIAEVGCHSGCGPAPDYKYNYGVSSPNVGLEHFSLPICVSNLRCLQGSNCNVCGAGDPVTCKASPCGPPYYTGNCSTECQMSE